MWYASSLLRTLGGLLRILFFFTFIFTISAMWIAVYKYYKPGYWETANVTRFIEVVDDDVRRILPLGAIILFAMLFGWYGVHHHNWVFADLSALMLFGCAIFMVWFTLWRYTQHKFWQYYRMFWIFYNKWAPYAKKNTNSFDFVAVNYRHQCCGRHSWEDHFKNTFIGERFYNSLPGPIPIGCCPIEHQYCWQWKASKLGCQWAIKQFFYKYLRLARFFYFMLSIMLIMTTVVSFGFAIALYYKECRFSSSKSRRQVIVQTRTSFHSKY